MAGFSPIAHFTPAGPPPLPCDFHHNDTHSAEPGSEPFGITIAINATPPASMHPIDIVSDDECSLSSKKPKYANRIAKNNDYNLAMVADGGMQTEGEGNKMVEMATDTVDDE